MQATHQEIDVSTTQTQTARPDPSVAMVDMRLEVHVIPVSDADRSKQFYERLGWRLDDDVAPMDGLRIVQLTPPGSATAVTFGQGLTTAAPGSALAGITVSDIEAARAAVVSRGIAATDIWHGPPFPPEGAAARRRTRALQLWIVLLHRRPRRQHVADPRGHDAAPRPGRRRRRGVRIH